MVTTWAIYCSLITLAQSRHKACQLARCGEMGACLNKTIIFHKTLEYAISVIANICNRVVSE